MLGGLGPAGAWGGTSQGPGPQGESEPDADGHVWGLSPLPQRAWSFLAF